MENVPYVEDQQDYTRHISCVATCSSVTAVESILVSSDFQSSLKKKSIQGFTNMMYSSSSIAGLGDGSRG